MKNFLVLVVNLGVVAFALAALGTFANYLFGLSLGFKGSTLPADPASGAAFLVVAGIFGGIAYLINRKSEVSQPGQG